MTKHGVSQGSILRLLLLILYINDISNVIKSWRIKLFPDDTLIYLTENSVDKIIDSLKKCGT